MMTESESALRGEKALRAAIKTALKAMCISEECAAADLLACKTFVATLDKKRANGIAANKPNDVIDIDGKAIRARVAVEIAAAKWETLTVERADLVRELDRAKTAVDEAAKAVIVDRMIGVAAKIESVLDDVLAPLVAQLQALSSGNFLNTPLSVARSPVPVEVTRVLERLPKRNPYDIPVNELRTGASSDAWQKLFAELTADDEPIDVDVAA
jgi:hypothetical protein